MPSIPVLYYHRVADVDRVPQDVGLEQFEAQMSFLAENGWNSLSVSQFKSFFLESAKFPRKSVLVTFDDGFLDNWVYAFPILKKYGVKAAIFLITDRITDGDNSPRPSLEDVESGKIKKEQLPQILSFSDANRKGLGPDEDKAAGFLTWSEVSAMHKSGLVSFESHSHTHGAHFISDEITGIIDSNVPHWAMTLPTNGDARLGIPLYRKVSLLKGKRYHDDLKLRDAVAEFVDKNFRENFYTLGAKAVEKEIRKFAADYRKEHGAEGRFESDSERHSRVLDELATSRRIIEERLGKAPDSICWPWGHFDDFAIKTAREAGYSLGFSTRSGTARPGMDPFRIRRLAVKRWNVDTLRRWLYFWTGPLAGTANIFAN